MWSLKNGQHYYMDKSMQYDAVLLDATVAHQFDSDSCIWYLHFDGRWWSFDAILILWYLTKHLHHLLDNLKKSLPENMFTISSPQFFQRGACIVRAMDLCNLCIEYTVSPATPWKPWIILMVGISWGISWYKDMNSKLCCHIYIYRDIYT